MSTRKTKATRRRRGHAELRAALLERREELLRQMRGGLADSRLDRLGARFDDLADRASDSLYNELAHGVAEIATADLRRIDRALEKIDKRTYGRCEACGKAIPKARLRVLPFADLCVGCQEQFESEAGADDFGTHLRPRHSSN
jgi:DnaK suppressor protein